MFDFKRKYSLQPIDRCGSAYHPYHYTNDLGDEPAEEQLAKIEPVNEEMGRQRATIYSDDQPIFSVKTRDGHTWICSREEDLKWANLITVAYIGYRDDGSMEYVN